MVSVEKWKSHFKRLAHKAFPHEDMYIVTQSGRGLGRNSYNRTLYQIRTPTGASAGKPTVEIVSPIASTLGRAKALTKTIKRKKKKGGPSSTPRGRGRKKSSKVTKVTKKKKAAPKKTGKKRKKTQTKTATAGTKAGLAAGARHMKKKKKATKQTRRKKRT